jgi:hypothetical protein
MKNHTLTDSVNIVLDTLVPPEHGGDTTAELTLWALVKMLIATEISFAA